MTHSMLEIVEDWGLWLVLVACLLEWFPGQVTVQCVDSFLEQRGWLLVLGRGGEVIMSESGLPTDTTRVTSA